MQHWDDLILPRLEEEQPCYLLYRLDDGSQAATEWIFLSYSPDYSPVRCLLPLSTSVLYMSHDCVLCLIEFTIEIVYMLA